MLPYRAPTAAPLLHSPFLETPEAAAAWLNRCGLPARFSFRAEGRTLIMTCRDRERALVWQKAWYGSELVDRLARLWAD